MQEAKFLAGKKRKRLLEAAADGQLLPQETSASVQREAVAAREKAARDAALRIGREQRREAESAVTQRLLDPVRYRFPPDMTTWLTMGAISVDVHVDRKSKTHRDMANVSLPFTHYVIPPTRRWLRAGSNVSRG